MISINVSSDPNGSAVSGVAVIGMSGRFPGAMSVEAFWENLKNGVETISHFKEEELEASVATAEAKRQGAKFVNARSIIEHADMFDASFFNIYPKEAEVMDPQHRLFLECCWEALEVAGYDSEAYPGLIGVLAGLSMNTYLLSNLVNSREFAADFTSAYQVGAYQVMLGNDKDFMPVRVAYKLNLRGPAFSIQCACSTSLVAICHACQSLMSYQCDMVLAGGSSITFPQKRNYIYQEDAMVSDDGTCRTFDAKARGTVFGHGVGVVLLKRVEDAIADGDTILAVIRGFAVNNDGSQKVGFAAPSIQAQADVIAMAQAMTDVDPETISYIEAHGTATPLGDPIEIAALTQAFRARTQAKGFCAIGTAKTYVGHLDVAAGVTGLIKTILQLQHNLIPPLLHFESPNPKINFADSPVYPVTKLMEWKRGATPRRAGVSAFGVGGTNAHVVVEEAPPITASSASRPHQALLLSAKTPTALDQMTVNLAAHLEKNPQIGVADVAFTLQKGRRAFPYRRLCVCADAVEAVSLLRSGDKKRVFTAQAGRKDPPVAFMFPGQGAQYVNMGKELYTTEAVFRDQIDQCAEILKHHLDLDLRALLYPSPGQEDQAKSQINQTDFAQPALFMVEYALARLWMSWGIRPAAMVGHSLGEYVAAVMAGVMSLEDGLALLAFRARLMRSMPAGGMLSVRCSEAELIPTLKGSLAIAVINSTKLCVVSGPHPELEALRTELEKRQVVCKPLWTSHAFHSSMMDPIVEPFTRRVEEVKLSAGNIPIVSTVTGKWVEQSEWTDPSYWARQLRYSVRFADAASELVAQPNYILLEVGPGQTLATLVQQQPKRAKEQLVLPSMPPIEDPGETISLLTALGRLWLAGMSVDWDGFYRHERRRRVPLPTYPFERRRFWIEPPKAVSRNEVDAKRLAESISDPCSITVGRAVSSHAEIAPPPITSEPLRPLAVSASEGKSSTTVVEQIIDEQLRLMSSQLEALR
jgi:phthiocerol/phenolphthiocerol synthesis type-I polyketide synthase E